MFNKRNRSAKFVIHIQNKARHIFFFFYIHAGHRFVKQQQLWLRGQRAGQLYALFQTIRQTRHGGFADRLNFQEINHLFTYFSIFQLFALGSAPPERLLKHPRFHLRQPARHHIVQHRHPFEQRNVLKGARDALPGHFIRLHRRAFFSMKPHFTILGMIKSRNHVEH